MEFQSSILSKAANYQALTNQTPSTYNLQFISSVMPNVESVIEIDAALRKITIPDELKNIAVEGDHLSETIFFRIPRYFDGDDLSSRNCKIRYVNAGSEYGESEICDMEIFDDFIKFGWSIENRVTRYRGVINFTVQFETIENGIEYQWQTTPAQLNVLAGLNIQEIITDKDDVLFRTLNKQIQELQKVVEQLEIKISSINTIGNQVDKLSSDVRYLQDNVVYTLDE